MIQTTATTVLSVIIATMFTSFMIQTTATTALSVIIATILTSFIIQTTATTVLSVIIATLITTQHDDPDHRYDCIICYYSDPGHNLTSAHALPKVETKVRGEDFEKVIWENAWEMYDFSSSDDSSANWLP